MVAHADQGGATMLGANLHSIVLLCALVVPCAYALARPGSRRVNAREATFYTLPLLVGSLLAANLLYLAGQPIRQFLLPAAGLWLGIALIDLTKGKRFVLACAYWLLAAALAVHYLYLVSRPDWTGSSMEAVARNQLEACRVRASGPGATPQVYWRVQEVWHSRITGLMRLVRTRNRQDRDESTHRASRARRNLMHATR